MKIAAVALLLLATPAIAQVVAYQKIGPSTVYLSDAEADCQGAKLAVDMRDGRAPEYYCWTEEGDRVVLDGFHKTRVMYRDHFTWEVLP